jgi:hypothetical protein
MCCIHNFICTHASDQLEDGDLFEPDCGNDCDDHDCIPEAAALMPDEPCARRDRIAQQMWDDYMEICNERDHDSDSEAREDEDNTGDEDGDEDEDEDGYGDAFEDDDEVERDLL